ncbi:hypothetical protein HNR31_002233 [Anoxybacillus caldiproteolyticus]|uniref:Uncharacterized protein n=1 Tax=Thermaerobacillus caldiproteolyticus TaxID=247480 RepID=A0A7V9Z7M4_9BACL|nr:hypothetical protein [Anoxybacillus caldiproteolyticus]
MGNCRKQKGTNSIWFEYTSINNWSSVYFIQHDGSIKRDLTTNIEKRVKEVQQGNPDK